jgi:hypothetical protein
MIKYGLYEFIAGLTKQHIQRSCARTIYIILDVISGSGKYISAMHGRENKHSLFIGLDSGLKGVQIAKRNNASDKRSEFIGASLYTICRSEKRFLMVRQYERLSSIFLQILKLALWWNCSQY